MLLKGRSQLDSCLLRGEVEHCCLHLFLGTDGVLLCDYVALQGGEEEKLPPRLPPETVLFVRLLFPSTRPPIVLSLICQKGKLSATDFC